MKRILRYAGVLILSIGTFSAGCTCNSNEREIAERHEQAEELQRQADELRRRADRMRREARELQRDSEEVPPDLEEDIDELERQIEDAVEEGMGELGQTLEEFGKVLSGEIKVQPVNFRDLKDLLPKRVAGMNLENASGERSGAFGIKISKSEGRYESRSGDAALQITITDLGSIKGATRFGYAWLMADIDRESDTGFERTLSYKGYPAHQEFTEDAGVGSGSMQVFVEDRFVVEAEGTSISWHQIENAVDQVDMKKLAAMKMEGVEAGH